MDCRRGWRVHTECTPRYIPAYILKRRPAAALRVFLAGAARTRVVPPDLGRIAPIHRVSRSSHFYTCEGLSPRDAK